MKKTYVQDPATGKFVEKNFRPYRSHDSVRGFEPVTCPTTGERIRDDKQMRELGHNTGQRVFSKDELIEQGNREVARRQNKPTPTKAQRRELRDQIADSIERASSSGFHRRERHE